MFTRKTPVSQLPDKNEFTCYHPHSVDLKNRKWPEVIYVVSIDPGIRNLALRVESRGAFSSSYPIKTIVFDKLHIKEDDRKLVGNVDQLFFLITNFLDQYLEIFKKCHMMIIERQIPINYRAVRISQHVISYFMFHFKDLMPALPMIFEVDPKLKGRELGASKHLNEKGIKQWSVDFARSLLTKRQDYEGLNILNKTKKKDDHADTVCQIEALFSFNEWPLTAEVKTLSINRNNSSINNPSMNNQLPPLSSLPPLPPSLPPVNQNKSENKPKTLTLKIQEENIPVKKEENIPIKQLPRLSVNNESKPKLKIQISGQ